MGEIVKIGLFKINLAEHAISYRTFSKLSDGE